MKSITKTLARIFLLVSAVLCVALALAQFLPYWTPTQEAIDTVKASYEEEREVETGPVSVFSYMILPSDHPVIEEYLGTNDYKVTDEHKPINSLAGTFCIAFAVGIVAVIFIVLKNNTRWVSMFPFAVGVASLIGYLTEPLWALGKYYVVMLALSGALAVVAAVPFVIWLCSIRFWFMDPKQLQKK